jgi:ribosomal protein S17E
MQNPESRKLFEEFYPEFTRNTNENFEAIIEQLLAVAEVIYL